MYELDTFTVPPELAPPERRRLVAIHRAVLDQLGRTAVTLGAARPLSATVDEFAYQSFDVQATNYLFRIVGARYGHGSIVLTANTGFQHWKNLFPTESTAVATVDRLVDQATILRFTGKSLRDPKEIVGAPLDE